MTKLCPRCGEDDLKDDLGVCPSCQHGFGGAIIENQVQTIERLKARLDKVEKNQ